MLESLIFGFSQDGKHDLSRFRVAARNRLAMSLGLLRQRILELNLHLQGESRASS